MSLTLIFLFYILTEKYILVALEFHRLLDLMQLMVRKDSFQCYTNWSREKYVYLISSWLFTKSVIYQTGISLHYKKATVCFNSFSTWKWTTPRPDISSVGLSVLTVTERTKNSCNLFTETKSQTFTYCCKQSAYSLVQLPLMLFFHLKYCSHIFLCLFSCVSLFLSALLSA